MRFARILAISLALAACRQQPAPSSAARPDPAASGGIHGSIAEKIDAAQYSYLRLQSADGELWAAVPKTGTPVGAEVTVVNAVWMENFKSTSMDRTWQRIAFGTLDEGGAPAGQLPPGHPPTAGQGMFAAAGKGSHPAPSAAADLGAIKVAKAAGPAGRTIAEIWASRAALKDRKVAVRGKVVKATNGVMGKNWLHLRDGSGQGASSDLTVATDGSAAVGDTVLVTGVVHLDKDLGAGYHYDVIVEDAQVQAE